jgi:hypothetical protein
MAFTSLRRQVRGLYGARGLLPIRELLDRARPLPATERYRWFPSIFWGSASDETLVSACRLGQLFSIALMVGLAPRVALAALWSLYLSFVSVGRDFMGFQWDGLLLETGLHAMLIAPSGLAPRLGRDALPPEDVLLMRWLVWRFYYEAGIAKVKSEDPTWRERTACSYHYETQPLPTRLGWYAHHLPASAHRMATTITLAVECGAPFLAFAPRRPRRLGFGLIAGLQSAIAATGNYGFFNALSITLALWLLDDEPLERALRLASRRRPEPMRGARRIERAALAGTFFLLSLIQHVRRFGKRSPPGALTRAVDLVEPLQSLHTYGLFTSMTVKRFEIVVEGSDDRERWLEYEFRYKPGNTEKPPRWVAPHQPRLDWQMWFAVFEPMPPAWFVRLMIRLLEGAPDVLGLLAPSPFPDRPPRYVRASLYEYRMTDIEVRRRTGQWWARDRLGEYFPTATLESHGSIAT